MIPTKQPIENDMQLHKAKEIGYDKLGYSKLQNNTSYGI